MAERRQHGRLSYPFPVKLETMFAYEKKVLNLVTRDISASGTFIPTDASFPAGTRFIMDFAFPSIETQEPQTFIALNGCVGTLVRSTLHGIAIQFERECHLECLKIL